MKSISRSSVARSLHSTTSSYRHVDKEDPLLVPVSTKVQEQEIEEKYENVRASKEEADPMDLLQKLWEYFKKYQDKEAKLMEKVIEQKDQIVMQSFHLEEESIKIAELQDIMQKRDQEILDVKRLVDASHLREQDSQETIEFLRGQIKKLETEIEVKERIQAEIDAEMGISGKTREAFTRDKDRMTSEIQSLRGNLKYTNELLSELQVKCDKAMANIAELQTELNSKKDDLNRMTKLKGVAEKETEEVQAMVDKFKNENANLKLTIDEKDEKNYKLENTIADLMSFVDKMKTENQELCKALSREQEEVYLLNCKVMEILESNEEFTKNYKVQEMELVRLRKDATKNANLQEANTKKVAVVEKAKDRVISELEKAKYEKAVKEKEIESKEREARKNKMFTDGVLREREILKKNVLRMAELARENLRKYQLEAQSKTNVEVERDVYKKEMGKLRLTMFSVQKDRERLMGENATLRVKYQHCAYENKEKQTEIYDCKKKVLEGEVKVKQATNMYEAVRTERNNLSHSLNETKDKLDEVQNKMKIINHQAEQLKEDIMAKETKLMQVEIATRKIEAERDALSVELKKCNESLKNSKHTISAMAEKEDKLNLQIVDMEKKNKALTVEVQKVVNDSGILATQLDRRSSELKLMYEKVTEVQVVLAQGEEQYNQRLEDIRILRLEVMKLRHEKEYLKRSFDNMADLRKEIYHLNRDLMNERQKCRALEEEMEKPVNIHRWRLLEGTDPDKRELLEKVQVVQKRLNKYADQEAVNQARIQELTELYEGAVAGLKRLPGIEATNELQRARGVIQDKNKQLMVITAELKVCEGQLEQYKIEVKTLKKDLNEMKKKYFALKFKEDKRKQRASNDLFRKEKIAEEMQLQKISLGGGYQLLPGSKIKDPLTNVTRPVSR